MLAEPVEKHRSAHVITLTGYLIGLPVESVLRIALHPPHAMEFKQVRGTLRGLSGSFALASVEDGTEVRYRLEVDPGIPMISDEAARQFLTQFVERMLDRIKLAAERKAPARRVDRVAAAPAGLEPEEDDAELSPAAVAPAATPPEAPASPPGSDARPSTEPTRSGKRRRRRRRRGRGRAPGSPGQGPSPAS
jgi:hypothetical protein